MLKAIPRNCRVVALDVKGKAWNTEQLSSQIGNWMNNGQHPAILNWWTGRAG